MTWSGSTPESVNTPVEEPEIPNDDDYDCDELAKTPLYKWPVLCDVIEPWQESHCGLPEAEFRQYCASLGAGWSYEPYTTGAGWARGPGCVHVCEGISVMCSGACALD